MAIVGEAVLKNVRLSFPKLWKKEAATDDAKPKYGASFLMDPATPDGKRNVRACQQAIEAVMMEKFKRKVTLKPGREGMQDGDDVISDKTGEPYVGYEGMKVVTAKNDKKFPIVDRRKRPVSEEDDVIYAGCYVNVVLRFYGIDGKEKGGNGIFASLEALQFAGDGEAFGGGSVDVDDYFEDFEDDGGADAGYDDDLV